MGNFYWLTYYTSRLMVLGDLLSALAISLMPGFC
jgi:hypothetical protein